MHNVGTLPLPSEERGHKSDGEVMKGASMPLAIHRPRDPLS